MLEKGAPPLHGQETIWREGECVGFVRSTAYGKKIRFGGRFFFFPTFLFIHINIPLFLKCVFFLNVSGHALGRTVAYGYVEKGADETKVTNKWLKKGVWEIGDRGTKLGAELHLKAPYDPLNLRIHLDTPPLKAMAPANMDSTLVTRPISFPFWYAFPKRKNQNQ